MDDVSGNNFIPNTEDPEEYVDEPMSSYEYETLSQSSYDSVDYTSHFENLETIGCVLIFVLIGCAMAITFFQGIRK